MLQAYQDAHDGMPLLISLYRSQASQQGKANSTAGFSVDMLDDDSGLEEESYKPPAQCILYEIPGELILAKERKKDTQYWPAKIMRYHAPSRPSEKPLYEVLFFDGMVKKLPDDGDMFFTEGQAGFHACKVRKGVV